MEYGRIRYHLRHAVSFRLLRSDHAPFILHFLYDQFKRRHRISRPHSELVAQLADFQEELRETKAADYPRPAREYLKRWCDEEHGFLQRYYPADADEPVYRLTPGAEKAIAWLDELDDPAFVGTESRFLRIFDLLDEIVEGSTEDPQVRMEQLEQQKAALEAEIERIEETGTVERYTTTQLRERFQEAHVTARRLLSDFAAVEQRFRQIAREVQAQQLEESVQKGAVVRHVLEADEALKESDQGRSFYAFWRFLCASSKQDELEQLLNQVYDLPELAALEQEYTLLRRLKTNLIRAGDKVVQSNHRLGRQLRRLLDEGYRLEHRRVRELSAAIKKEAAGLQEPVAEPFWEMEGEPDADLIMERPPWSPSERPDFAALQPERASVDLEAVEAEVLFDRFFVDAELIEKRLGDLLQDRPQVTLSEVVETYPVEKGLSEVLQYCFLASREAHHLIDDSVRDDIVLQLEERSRPVRLSLPRIIFTRP